MNKNMLYYYAALLSMAAMDSPYSLKSPVNPDEISEEERQKIIEEYNRRDRERNLAKGLKEFTIDGITVYAINYKNAVRKINKLKT